MMALMMMMMEEELVNANQIAELCRAWRHLMSLSAAWEGTCRSHRL